MENHNLFLLGFLTSCSRVEFKSENLAAEVLPPPAGKASYLLR
jgi:hypothetical protein